MTERSQRFHIRETALLVFATVLAYLPSLRNGFVFDDWVLLVKQPPLAAADLLRRIWFTTEAPDYYPLTWTSWWAQRQLWGMAPLGYHVVNVLLHALNVVLLSRVLRRLDVRGAWLAALIFALHPANVASVTWVSEHKNLLSMLFFLATVLAYLRYDDDGKWRWYAISIGCFFLSLLAKPAAVMWPVVLLGLAWWKRGTVTRRNVGLSMPYFVMSLAIGLLTVWVQTVLLLGGQASRSDSFLARLASAGWVVWFYLFKLLLPVRLSMIYPRWLIDPSKPLVYVPGLLLAFGLGWLWSKRGRHWGRDVLAGIGYFIIMLFPVLGFFDQGFYRISFVADQWHYLAMPGVIAVVVSGAVVTTNRALAGQHRRAVQLAGAIVVVSLGLLTWNRSHVFFDDESLWRDTIRNNPRAWSAYYNLGATLASKGRTTESIAAYEAALRVKPDYPDALDNLGLSLYGQGRVNEALSHWRAAVRYEPGHVESLNNLGAAYASQGDLKHAALYFSLVLILKPDDAQAHANLGTVYLNQGKLVKAIDQFQAALRVDPRTMLAWQNLGFALAQSGRMADAIEVFQRMLQIDPANPVARAALQQLRGKAAE